MSLRITILALTCCLASFANAADPKPLPEGVAAWKKSLQEMQTIRVSVQQKKLDDLLAVEKSLPKQKLTAKDKSAKMKEVKTMIVDQKSALADEQAKRLTDYSSMIGISNTPKVGDIGTFGGGTVIDASDDFAILRVGGGPIPYTGPQRNARAPTNELMIEGVDSTKWPNGTRVKLSQTFEAVRVDQGSRLMVLKPFDVEKWKLLVDTEVKPNPNPEVKPESKPKAKP